MKNILITLLSTLVFTSCTPTLKLLTGVRNPKVRSDQKADEFLQRLPDTLNVYDARFKKIDDKTDILLNLMKGMGSEAHVYDKEQDLLCYQGDSFCSGVVLTEAENNQIEDIYQKCSPEETNLGSAPIKLNTLFENLAFEDEVPEKATYTVVFFWSYDLARKFHEENWLDVYESFKSKEDVEFIRVNTDLRSSWNLPEGKKGKIKFKRDGDEVDMSIVVPFYED